ncbi:MAG: hypothetical protein RRC34_12670 [Lentisphaeria bacterium]|nr:hypothetical protein [Lentisphaeria bacterium]
MMKARINHDALSSDRGTLLLVTLFIIAATAMTAVGVVSYVQYEGKSQHQYDTMTKARYTALGAANKITAKLNEVPGRLESPTNDMLAGTIGGNPYQVTYTGLRDGTTKVEVAAACQGTPATVLLYAHLTPAIGGSDTFDKAILSENDVVLSGNSTVTENNGTVHSNQDAFADGSSYLDGNLTAVGTADGTASNVTGLIQSNAPYDAFPRLNYDYYYEIARADGMVFTGNQKFTKTTLSPPGGVIWVEGDVLIGNGVTFNACLVATGDIKTTSTGSVFTPPQLQDGSDAPALISVNGDISMTAQRKLVGLVYAGSGAIKFNGAWKEGLTGAICAWDDIHLLGGAGLRYDPNVVDNLGDGVISREESVDILAMER